MAKSKSVEKMSAQQDVQGENLNDFVSALSQGGKLKQHSEHDNVRRAERQINKFTRFTDLNRFNNAVLFSQGSVELQPEEKGDTSYIHASKIPCPGGALILAQAPLKVTIVDFYRLIWQQKVSTIVCLVNLENKEECYPYFERKAGKKTSHRNYKVRTVAVRGEGKHIIHYELKIENHMEKKENKSRVLNVIAILGWEPEQAFDPKIIVSAIHSADALHRIGPQSENGKDAPMLIHGCSGIRRTGVFALAYIFSKQILVNREINLLGVIEQVRMVRYGVLRKKKMFYMLLEIIVQLITETGLVKPNSEDHLTAVQMVKKMYGIADAKGRKKKSKNTGGGKSSEQSSKAEKSEATKTDYDDDDDDEGGGDDDDKSQTGKDTTGGGKSPGKKTGGSKEKRGKKK